MRKTGLTLLEVALVLAIIAFAFVGMANMMADTAGAARARTTAQKMQQIADASKAYVRANQSAIDAYLTAKPTETITIPVAKQTEVAGQPVGTTGFQSLQSAGFLPLGFVDRTANGQSHALLIKAAPGGKIDAVLSAHGGIPLSDKDLTTLTSSIGAAGGAVYDEMTATPDTHIVGTYAGWTYATEQWVGQLDGASVQPQAGRPVVSLAMEVKSPDTPNGNAMGKGPKGTIGFFPDTMICSYPGNPTPVTLSPKTGATFSTNYSSLAYGTDIRWLAGSASTTLGPCGTSGTTEYLHIPESGQITSFLITSSMSGPTTNGWYTCSTGQPIYSSCNGRTLDEMDSLGLTDY